MAVMGKYSEQFSRKERETDKTGVCIRKKCACLSKTFLLIFKSEV